jgi:hypothetical protein
MAGRIGVNDPAPRVDQEHAGTDRVERIGERRGFRSLQVDDFADEYRTPDMRDDQPHPPPRLVVHKPVALVPEHAERGDAGERLVQDGADEIHQALGRGPFLVEAGLEELLVGHHVGGGDDLSDPGEEMAGGGRVYLDVLVEVEPDIPPVLGPIVIEDVAALAGGVLGVEGGGGAADIAGDVAEGRGPQQGVERSVIDVADQVREHVRFLHKTPAPRCRHTIPCFRPCCA